MKRERDASLDLMKCIAALLVTNSHLEMAYAPLSSSLATGGAIGNSLFFFVSGYALFLGPMRRFDNYYKRRLRRIFPSIFAWAAIGAWLFGRDISASTLFSGGGNWFISCILVYYILLWCIRRFCLKRLWLAVSAVLLFIVVYYRLTQPSPERIVVFNRELSNVGLVAYFSTMLAGAVCGFYAHQSRLQKPLSLSWALIGTLCSIVAYYGGSIAAYHFAPLLDWQIVLYVPLVTAAFFLWQLCQQDGVVRWFKKPFAHRYVYPIGALCLEIYLVQYAVITDRLNWLFPLNIPLILLGILALAYVTKVASNIILQIFQPADLDWKVALRL